MPVSLGQKTHELNARRAPSGARDYSAGAALSPKSLQSAIQAECAAWLSPCPKPYATAPPGEALQAIVDLDLDQLAAVEPPRGYGRD